MRPQFNGLWRHRDFTKLWAGQTVSLFGSMLTLIALPLTALLTLNSSPLEQGFLQAVQAGPVLVTGLFAGVWVDRLRRRPVMIVADLARAALLLTIPATAFAGRLTMVQMYVVAATVAIFTALFDAAYPAYLPTLVGRANLVEGNAKLSATSSVAEMGGFAAAGALVQFLSGPLAILVDALTFVVSALTLGWIQTPEPQPISKSLRKSAVQEAVEGISVVWHDPTLRALIACSTTFRLAGGVFASMYMLFAVRDLGLSPAAAGVIAGCGGFGSLIGSMLARPALRRLGVKPTLVLGFALGGAFQCLVPLAHGTILQAALFLLTAQILGDGLLTMAFVNDTSLRQALVPDRLLGRVSATANVFGVVAMPVGALAGGIIGQLASPRAALAGAALTFTLASLWVIAAPIRSSDDDVTSERSEYRL
ncbi:MAG TPA: MFS transporter [Blastocatellia bacterium]|nr:MFS transporter [Blastocatellia bacterium]